MCRYGGKCQFAHGSHELRPVQRHPKYKTEVRCFSLSPEPLQTSFWGICSEVCNLLQFSDSNESRIRMN